MSVPHVWGGARDAPSGGAVGKATYKCKRALQISKALSVERGDSPKESSLGVQGDPVPERGD